MEDFEKITTWKTKDGTVVKIKDMTTNHIKNCMSMIERNFESYKLSIPYPNFNGEMAQECAEMEYDGLMQTSVDELPTYKAFEEELIRRGEYARKIR